MKNRQPFHVIAIAALLGTAPLARAFVTETWDGGGADNNISTALNWLDNTAPAGGFLSDLIFAGTMRVLPNFPSAFSANSVTFNSTAGAFTISGSQLNVSTGITNNSVLTKAFTNAVSFSTATTATINATSGDLRFNGAMTMPLGTLFVSGPGTTILGGSLAVGAGTTLSLGGDFTVSGGLLTRDTTGVLTLAAGKTLTAQSGGDVTITGAFTASNGSAIAVTGAGSTFSTTSTLTLNNASTVDVLSGGALTSSTFINIGSGGGTITVDGVGSTVGSATANIASSNGSTGTLTLSNGSTGTFTSTMNVDNNTTVGSNGTVNIQTAATVNAAGLAIAPNAFANTGLISVVGTGSSFTLTGASTATIGAASASSGTLNVQSGGTFTSGTGLTTVNATGDIVITGGTYNSLGDLTLNGGQLTRDATGVFTLAAGKTLTVQGGGDATITGTFTNNTAATIIVTGTGSTFSTTSTLTLGGGTTLNVQAAGTASSGAGITLGSNIGSGSVNVTGGSSAFSGGTLTLGLGGGAGNLTLSNSSQGTFGAINVDASTNSLTTGSLLIQSGADVTGTSLSIAPNAVGNSGSVTVNGSGSTLTLTGAATASIGAASGSSGTLNVQNNGVFTSGTGLSTVNSTGVLNVTNGGSVVIRGGLLHQGVFNVAAGSTAVLNGTLTGSGGFTGGGTVSFSSEGSVYDPGPGPVAVSFGGDLELGINTVVFEIGGTTPGTQHDRLNVAGNLTIYDNTTLEVHFINGFVPAVGQTFDLIDAAAFTIAGVPRVTVVAPGLLPGFQFKAESIPASGIVRLTAMNDGVPTGTGTVWDGGGADNLLTNSANWIGNTAPPSSLTSGLLTFTGGTRTAPQVTSAFSARGLYFTNNGSTASFNIAGPQTLSIGNVGIFNDTTLTHTFNCPVNFSGVPQSWVQSPSGPLVFNGTVTLPTTMLNVQTGSSITLRNVIGTGAISVSGSGIFLSPSSGVQQYDLSAYTGITTVADGSTDVFGSSASLNAITLNINESLTLDGAPLSAVQVNLAAGKHGVFRMAAWRMVAFSFQVPAPLSSSAAQGRN